MSLPNGTSSTRELDQLFEKFKPACSKSALQVASKKMKLRMEVRLAEKNARTNVVDLNKDKSDEYNESDDSDDNAGKRKGRSICIVSFSNLDLANLANGWPDDPVELRLFDYISRPRGSTRRG